MILLFVQLSMGDSVGVASGIKYGMGFIAVFWDDIL
jgi:hypothetical protein